MAAEPQGYATRLLSAKDWQAFAEIRLEALQKYPQFFGSTFAKEVTYTKEDWQKWLGHKDGCVFGLYHEGEIVGITGAITSRDDLSEATGLLIASYIKPAHQGKGLAATLYDARIKWALSFPQWTKLVVGHRDGNEPSRRANQRWGFRFTEKKARTWPDGATADDYYYELDLDALRRKKH